MTMSYPPLFAIVLRSGSYDDTDQETLFVTDDENAANVYVTYQQELHTRVRDKVTQCHAYIDQWCKDNPSPTWVQPVLAPVPKLNGSKPITAEMRAEKKRVQSENDALSSAAMKDTRAWLQDQNTARKKWFETNMTPEEMAAMERDRHNLYYVEPLTWMPPLETLITR